MCVVATLSFAGVEAIGGWLAGSLALVSDAGHMLTDSVGLSLALLAALVATRRPTPRYTYGLGRVEVVAAVVNGLLMCGIVTFVAIEAVERLRSRPAVHGGIAMAVAGVGLLVNVVVAKSLLSAERTLNVRAAFLHGGEGGLGLADGQLAKRQCGDVFLVISIESPGGLVTPD